MTTETEAVSLVIKTEKRFRTYPLIMLKDSVESNVAAPGKSVTVSFPALMMSASIVSSVG